jgi:hypothetical protein
VVMLIEDLNKHADGVTHIVADTKYTFYRDNNDRLTCEVPDHHAHLFLRHEGVFFEAYAKPVVSTLNTVLEENPVILDEESNIDMEEEVVIGTQAIDEIIDAVQKAPVTEPKLSDIDVTNLDAVIQFANSVQDEVVYTRRNKLANILADLKANGY